MAGFRITARSLERQGLSENVLQEFMDLENIAAFEPQAVTVPAEKVVFVLEDDDRVIENPIVRRE